jgi:D-sedoheptulose 7-phosphate isomerase
MTYFDQQTQSHISVVQSLHAIQDAIDQTVDLLVQAISRGSKLLICGNGGSAADAQHFAAEIVGRFKKERRPWPAMALTTDTSILTAVGNDYGFDEVFARQVAGIGKPGDILMGISTSGNSPNVLKAVETARDMDMITSGLLGKDGGNLAIAVDYPLVVQSRDTARIQEAHIFLIHYMAECLETRLMDLS